jgi:hypothetical protein
MRTQRLPLTVLVLLFVLFDVYEAGRIYQFGWPPADLLDISETGEIVIPVATRGERVAYGLFELAIVLVQIFVFRLTWKAWRKPKPDRTK